MSGSGRGASLPSDCPTSRSAASSTNSQSSVSVFSSMSASSSACCLTLLAILSSAGSWPGCRRAPSARGKENSDGFLSPFTVRLTTMISSALNRLIAISLWRSNFSIASQSAISRSPDHPPPTRWSYPTKMPPRSLDPNFPALALSFMDEGRTESLLRKE